MLQSGQAIEFERRIGLSTYTAIGMWVPLSDGSFRSLVVEKVRHWFSSPTWQIVGVGPGKSMSLEQIVDSFVFSPKAASSAQSQANAAQFVLHVIPLGGFADHLSQGDYKEAVISIASDAATLLTGGGSKAISATRAAKSLGATQAGLRTAGLAIESSIIGIRGLEGGVKLTNGHNANAEVAEVILRLFGVKSKISGNASGVARIADGAASSKALKGAVGFAQGTAVDAVRNIGRIDHAGRHLSDFGVIAGNQGTKAFREAVRSNAIRILENPLKTFDHVIGGQQVKGFYGMIDGKQVVFFVAKEPRGKIGIGEVVTAVVPSAQQIINWGL